MSQETVEIVRRSLEHYLRTDELLWDIIDPEVELHDHDVPDAARVYRGHAEWLEWAALFDDAWEDISAEVEGYIDAGAKVVVVLRLVARGRGGIALEQRNGSVHTVRDGMIVRLDYYGDLAEALEAVGLSE